MHPHVCDRRNYITPIIIALACSPDKTGKPWIECVAPPDSRVAPLNLVAGSEYWTEVWPLLDDQESPIARVNASKYCEVNGKETGKIVAILYR